MQALCTYCRAMTTPAPSHPGRPRLAATVTAPMSEVGRPCRRRWARRRCTPESWPRRISVHRPSPAWPRRALCRPCLRERPRGGPAQAVTTTRRAPRRLGRTPSVRISGLANNEQTVHPTPQKQNACYARLRQQDHWWSPSPWVASTPTPVTRQYQAYCCFKAYVRCTYFRPVGTPEAHTTNADKLS